MKGEAPKETLDSKRDFRTTRKRTRYFPSHFKTHKDQDLIRRALHNSPILSSLDEGQIERFVAVAELKEYQSGDIVILEGCVDGDEDEDDDLFNRHANVRFRATRMPRAPPATDDDPSPPSKSEEYDDSSFDEVAGFEEGEMNELGSESQESGSESSAPAMLDSPRLDSQVNSKHPYARWQYSFPNLSESLKTNLSERLSDEPPVPPRSGIKRCIYIIRDGDADVWYQSQNFRPASLRRGALFGEGGFLFGRQHSASIVASPEAEDADLQCWVVDFTTFWEHVLPNPKMTEVFEQTANQVDENGVLYMTMEEFVQARDKLVDSGMPGDEDPMSNLRIVNALQQFLKKQDSSGESLDPRVYVEEFCFYQMLMNRPDPEVDIAFLLMDQRHSGQIRLPDLVDFVAPLFPELDTSSQFFQRYFGKDGTQSIRQVHFSQFLVDLQKEIGKQAFFRALQTNKEGHTAGYLSPEDFIRVLTTACGWRLPQGVAERLNTIYSLKESPSADSVSKSNLLSDEESLPGTVYFAYGDFLAFQEVLGNLASICNLIDQAEEAKQGPISLDDFKVANRVLGIGGKLSRRQVDIVFALFDRDRDGFVSRQDTVEVCGMDFAKRLVRQDGKLTYASAVDAKSEANMDGRELIGHVTDFVHRFGLTAAAGAFAALGLYPIDLVKTRLMNDRILVGGQGTYKGILDCLRSVYRTEGPLGMYRGLLPQLIGLAPERMIKLQVNDLIKEVLGAQHDDTLSTRQTDIWIEVLAGACAGASQLLITNPMEVTKIHLQLQGEASRLFRQYGRPPRDPTTFFSLVRQMGVAGVYRGATACLLRDVPFSAIYFPVYSVAKKALIRENGRTNTTVLFAGTLAGIPAALLTTPADVIKTRLQAVGAVNHHHHHHMMDEYQGVRDCAAKIYQQEGWQAFFRGAGARVLRVAPQLGLSLLAYEQLNQWASKAH